MLRFCHFTKGWTPLPKSCPHFLSLVRTCFHLLVIKETSVKDLLNVLMLQPLSDEHKLLASVRILPFLPIRLPHALGEPLGSMGVLPEVPGH